jgi:hypothetical protein
MGYKRTGKPPGRPRNDGKPAGSLKQEPLMAQTDETPTPETAAPAPAANFAGTPEFQQAVAEAVRQSNATMMMEMAKLFSAAKPGGDLGGVLSELAVNIAQMTNTGSNRKVITPDESKRRMDAYTSMGKLLDKVRAEGQHPHYKVTGQTWIDGILINPKVPDGQGKWKDTEIIWMGIPNTAMAPLNEVAKELFNLFLISIGGSARIDYAPEQSVWATHDGLIMVGDNPPQSLVQRGNVHTQKELGTELSTTNELTSPDDPNATRIPILGKTFPPAERTAPGNIPNLKFAASQ